MRVRRIVALALLVLAGVTSVARGDGPPNHQADGEITVGQPIAEPLKDACGVAIDPTGRIFVANYYQHAVYVFLSNGEFETSLSIEQPPLAPNGKAVNGPCDLAIDSAGNLYVNRWHYDVLRFPRLSLGSPTYGPGLIIDSHGSTSVSVDSTGSTPTDHVYVDDRTYVAEYDSSGAPVLTGGEPLKIGLGSLGSGYGVAVSGFGGSQGFPATSGLVYVADATDGMVKVFDPGGDPSVPVQVIDGGGTPQLGFVDLRDADLAVDPSDGHLYVVDNLEPFFEEPEAVVDEFSSLGHFRGTVPTNSADGHPTNVVAGEPSAIAIQAGKLYLTSGNYFNDNDEPTHPNSRVLIFGPAASVETRILTVAKSGSGSGTVFSSSPAGLGCGSVCEGEFTVGATVVLTAMAAPHSRFAGWTGCNPLAGLPPRCTVSMGADHAAGAEFEAIPQLPLTVTRSGSGAGTVFSVPAGLDCGGGCQASFDEGSTVTLSADPAEGSYLVGWTGCATETPTGTCLVTLDAARSVAVRFDRSPEPEPPQPPPRPAPTLAVSVAATGSAEGTVVSEPAGIDCAPACARPYANGSAVTLHARPAPGSKLLGWGGCDSVSGLSCMVMLEGDRTIVAAFGPGSRGSLRVPKLRVQGAAGVLRVGVPAAGTLSVSGNGLAAAEQLPLRPGPTALPIRLNRAGARALQHAHGGRLTRSVALAFTPFDGGDTISATPRVTFVRGGHR